MQVEDHDNNSLNPSLQSSNCCISGSFTDYQQRIDSFVNYPLPHNVNIIQLARHGFYYSPSSRVVTCSGCGKEIESWNIGDVPNDPRFHDMDCHFLQNSTNSSMGEVSNITESLVRASVHSAKEWTKPLETAVTSANVNKPLMPVAGASSLSPFKEKATMAMQYRESTSLPPPHTKFEFTHIRRVDVNEGVTDVSHLRAVRSQKSQEQLDEHNHSQPSSLLSTHSNTPSGSFQPALRGRAPVQESNFSFTNSPSTSLAVPQLLPFSRLENPDNVEQVLSRMNMRDAEQRLISFQKYWTEDNAFRNVRLLVRYGFYCLGQGDAVECFYCHLIAANWERNDNPKERHAIMSPQCRFIHGEDCGDIPLRSKTRRITNSPTQGRNSNRSSPYHSLGLNSIAQPAVGGRNMDPLTQRRDSNHSSPYHSLGHNPIAQPAPEPQGATAQESQQLQHSASFIERTNLFVEFPCLNPANPSMRDEYARLQTFNNQAFRQNTRLVATNETLVASGLYYIGFGDRCKCWFCDGGLEHFLPGDDPWVEHAKFFPQCEYLLQQRGPAWVTSISVQNPDIHRPILPMRENRILPSVVSAPNMEPTAPSRIEDPQQLVQTREQMVEEGMQSDPVQTAISMGFSEQKIREVQMQKILSSNCCYQTSEALIEALINPNGEPEMPVRQRGNVIDISGQTITIRGGNIVGPSIINGRVYRSQDLNRPRRRRRNVILINGQPMEEYMTETFNNPFFTNSEELFGGPHTTSTRATFRNVGNEIPTGGRSPSVPEPAPQTTTAPGLASSPSHSPVVPASTPITPVTNITSGSAESASTGGATAATSRSAEERLEEIERERRCKVCYTNVADILFQPCGHICACAFCSNHLNDCPVCRRRIARFIRTYHS